MRRRFHLSSFFLCVVTVGCATTGATFNSGVGDKFMDAPPFYAGRTVAPESRIVLLPINYQRGSLQPATFQPDAPAGSPMAGLLADMNAYLLTLGGMVPSSATLPGTQPDVMFGCPADPAGDCLDDTNHTGGRLFRLAVGRPSQSWIAAASSLIDSSGADHLLVLSVEISNYYPRQRNIVGAKEVLLGTGYSMELPWLTSLDDPVQTIQLTGVLVQRDGKAVRIGAEGMLARRTSLPLSAIGVQHMVTDEDIARLRTLRRDDLPGRPLVWQLAVRYVVSQLTGREL